MSSRTKEIGLIGEQILIAEFTKSRIPVLLPIGNNSPYDMVIDYNGRFFESASKDYGIRTKWENGILHKRDKSI